MDLNHASMGPADSVVLALAPDFDVALEHGVERSLAVDVEVFWSRTEVKFTLGDTKVFHVVSDALLNVFTVLFDLDLPDHEVQVRQDLLIGGRTLAQLGRGARTGALCFNAVVHRDQVCGYDEPGEFGIDFSYWSACFHDFLTVKTFSLDDL